MSDDPKNVSRREVFGIIVGSGLGIATGKAAAEKAGATSGSVPDVVSRALGAYAGGRAGYKLVKK